MNYSTKTKTIKNSTYENIKSLISELIILKPNSENLLKLKKLIILPIQISYKKLQKVGLFLYVIVSIYRGILLPLFYLFLLQQRRVKGFICIRQRDTRVRLKHYYNDFYYVGVFVNTSFIFLAICGLIMYYFEFIENYLSTIGVPFPISLDQFQKYTFFLFFICSRCKLVNKHLHHLVQKYQHVL
jgi:hypothetical protein